VNIQGYIVESLRQRLGLPYEDAARMLATALPSYDLPGIWGIGAGATSWDNRTLSGHNNPAALVINDDLNVTGWWFIECSLYWTGAAPLDFSLFTIDRPPNVAVQKYLGYVPAGGNVTIAEVYPVTAQDTVGSFQVWVTGPGVGSLYATRRRKFLTTF